MTPTPPRGRIYDDITETIGATPLVRLSRLAQQAGVEAEILAKLEFFNPIASVKDRIGVAMIEALEGEGRIGPETVLIEPTSGNTGIALAFAAAAKGYRLILTMPESMSLERRKMLALLGARLELTDPALGMKGAIARAQRAACRDRRIRSSPSSSRTRPTRRSTSPRRPRRSGPTPAGSLDVFVSGVGTGGTITGVGRVLRERAPACRIVAVEPEDSPVLSGGTPGPHKIQGIGAGFVPAILDRDLIDEVLTVANETAFEHARLLARTEGIPGGISSGAAIAAALEIAERKGMAGKRIVVILPSFAERYLSTPLFDGL